jgi:hypothetical protein
MFVLLTGCPTNLFPFDGALMCVRRWISSVLLLLLILTRQRLVFSIFELLHLLELHPP